MPIDGSIFATIIALAKSIDLISLKYHHGFYFRYLRYVLVNRIMHTSSAITCYRLAAYRKRKDCSSV